MTLEILLHDARECTKMHNNAHKPTYGKCKKCTKRHVHPPPSPAKSCFGKGGKGGRGGAGQLAGYPLLAAAPVFRLPSRQAGHRALSSQAQEVKETRGRLPDLKAVKPTACSPQGPAEIYIRKSELLHRNVCDAPTGAGECTWVEPLQKDGYSAPPLQVTRGPQNVFFSLLLQKHGTHKPTQNNVSRIPSGIQTFQPLWLVRFTQGQDVP